MTYLIDNIAVIGAGTMGHGIAMEFAVNGCKVNLYDNRDALKEALEKIQKTLTFLAEKEIISKEQVAKGLKNINPTEKLEIAVKDTEYVVEAVPEDEDIKETIFREIDTLCPPPAIIASNTSGIPLKTLVKKIKHPSRALITHYWNPPHLIPLVELVGSGQTSRQTLQRTFNFLKFIGKVPVIVRQDIPGFIGNRLQHALMREVYHLIDRGYATPEEIDQVVKYGFGRRYTTLGPVEAMDLGGLDVVMNVQEYLFPNLNSNHELSNCLTEKVRAKKVGAKCGEGFYNWENAKLQDILKLRDEELIDQLKKDRKRNHASFNRSN
jgi:3-hydroxybutyryl-CoA dehydrogenase